MPSFESPNYAQLRLEEISYTAINLDSRGLHVRGVVLPPKRMLCEAAESQVFFTKVEAGMEIGRITIVIILIVLVVYFNNKKI
jgi:hypothetical protein